MATDPLGVRSGVGYLPEGACLPGDVTAADFVAFMGQLGGLPPRAARERAAEVCYQVVAADRGWALRRLSPRAPSLEETFLRLQAEASAPR